MKKYAEYVLYFGFSQLNYLKKRYQIAQFVLHQLVTLL
jgi:hypothetical protein